MQSLFEPTSLSLNHIQAIVRGMYAVARADDVHDTEKVLIAEFYNGCRRDAGGLADFNDVIKTDFNVDDAKDILSTTLLRQTFLRSCLLLAYADGHYSAKERACIGDFAKALEVDSDNLAVLEDEVTEYLLEQLAKVSNTDALCEVAKELKS